MGNRASPSVRCDYPSHTSAVYSRSCISTARSYTQYNLSSILQSFLHTRCSHTGTETQCKAATACGYCAQEHDTRDCPSRAGQNIARKCAACRVEHEAWSRQCPTRRTRWPRQGPRTKCGRAITTLRRQLGKARSLMRRRLLSEGEGPVNQLLLHNRYSSPGTDRKPDEDRRGQMQELPSNHRITKSLRCKQGRARDRIGRSYPPDERWRRLETAPDQHSSTTTVITWRSTPITMHE
jgi:hypothetical protein